MMPERTGQDREIPMGINEKRYTELTDKYMERLTGLLADYRIDTRNNDVMDEFGEFVCDAIIEAMKSPKRDYRYEVGELTETAINLTNETAPRHFYWQMHAGFTTQEEAEAYMERLNMGSRTKLFIDGVPIDFKP